MTLLCYLRNSFVDNERISIQPNDKNSQFFSLDNLNSGKINETLTAELFEEYKKNLPADDEEKNNKDKDKTKPEELRNISVFIYPLKYRSKIEHARNNQSKSNFICPLCIPAILSKDGILSGDPNLSPFISRLYLSPQGGNSSFPEISSVDAQDDFFTHNQYIIPTSGTKEEDDSILITWSKCWDYGEKLWQHLTGTALRDYKISQYELLEEGVILKASLVLNFSQHLIKLYDTLREKKPFTPLLKTYLSNTKNKEKKILKQNQNSLIVNDNYIGQINPKKPLSYSQNTVLDYFLKNEEDLFLTVNGPPGTGKTTLLQSVVANIWANAALDKTEPPIIVVTSTNNNAVTNVLENFKISDNDEPGLLFVRWLPHIHSFVTYCASSSRFKDGMLKQGWLVAEPRKNTISCRGINSYTDIENIEYLNAAREKFKSNFGNTFNKQVDSLSGIIDFLHEQLTQAANEIKLGCNYQKQLLIPFDKEHAQEKCIKLEEEVSFWLQKHKDFRGFEKGLPFYIRWGRYISVARKLFGKVEERYFKEFCLHQHLHSKDQDFHSEKIEALIITHAKNSQEELEQISQLLKTREKCEKQWQQWCQKHNLDCSVENLSEELNKTSLRSQIFYLATHYWEAKWLQDMEEWIKQKDKSQVDPKQEWLRRAKLTPCFVSTLYMLPRFFQEDSSYLYNFIDYLIIDEAGQVNTYVATPALSLAKRAIIVGDTKQLEPINSLPAVVDKGNLKKYNIIRDEKEYIDIINTGFAAHNSLMNRAHALSEFKQEENQKESGFFLKEHWRCVPEIASFCNELAYNGCLEPKRSKLENRIYPAFGYAHIPGKPDKKRGSRFNSLEAQAIGKWLKKNEKHICERYNNKPLHEIVAIITPFKAQSELLKKVFYDLKVSKNITVGTVHSLQGAERPIIIFSPTYGDSDSLEFIDKKVNFLNVSLSRAQDSFLVFGNIAQFNASSATPSGLLARKLFSHEENEIVDIDITPYQYLGTLKAEFVDSLEHHRSLLKKCIQEASNKVLIVSPYISINAILNDSLEMLIIEATARGTKVSILTDDYLNKQSAANTLKGIEKLEKAGANINIQPIA